MNPGAELLGVIEHVGVDARSVEDRSLIDDHVLQRRVVQEHVGHCVSGMSV